MYDMNLTLLFTQKARCFFLVFLFQQKTTTFPYNSVFTEVCIDVVVWDPIE